MPAIDKSVAAMLVLALALSACSALPDWMGGSKKEEKRLEGDRISVLALDGGLQSDPALKDAHVDLPAMETLEEWPQEAGKPGAYTGNLQLSGKFAAAGEAKIGDGNGWETLLITQPVVAGGLVFAMDARGYISCHDAYEIASVRWVSGAAVEKDEPQILGGGLAVDGNVLFVTTGFGRVIALDAVSGKELWRQSLGIPLRAAPRLMDDRLYTMTVDNQLFALASKDGKILWNHRGINDTAGFLGMTTPVADENYVFAPYSSGELFALRAESGDVAWSDSLLKPRRTSATAVFSGMGGHPVIYQGRVYAAGNGGLLGVNDIAQGRRIFDQDISSANPLWLAGDYMFALSTSNEAVCMQSFDGRVKWVQSLARPADDDEPVSWTGPLVAGGQVVVVNSAGKLLTLAAENGQETGSFEIPDNIFTMPVVASGTMYLVTRDGVLHALR